MQTLFSKAYSDVKKIEYTSIHGRVRSVAGVSLVASGLNGLVGIGHRVKVYGRNGITDGEVVAVGGARGGVTILPYGTWDGICAGDRVKADGDGADIYPDESWLGCVVDALGCPLSPDATFSEGVDGVSLRRKAQPAFDRRRVGRKLETGIRVIDLFTPICQGQRMGIFAGSGVGKSTLMSMLVRQSEADVIVIGLVGERGRELQEFIQDDLGAEGLARSVVVAATGDESPLMRRQAAWTATAVAEYFRDHGKHVLLMIDSITRFAMAQREIGLAAGEPPTAKGYPPTVFSELPRLLERAGPGTAESGDITGLFTVLVDGDDHNEPIADAVRGIMDGHIVLDRSIAERGRFPAVNLQKSVSRMLPECHSDIEFPIMDAARRIMARHTDMEDLVRMGAYRNGTDPEVDMAIRFATPAEAFLSQSKGDSANSATAFAELYKMLDEAGCEVNLPEHLAD